MLDGAPCPDAQARRAHDRARARHPRERVFEQLPLWCSGAARRSLVRSWGGGARRTEGWPRAYGSGPRACTVHN